VLLFVLILSTGVLQPPDRMSLAIARDLGNGASEAAESANRWLAQVATTLPEGGTVTLPEGPLHLDEALLERLARQPVRAERIHGADGRPASTLSLTPGLAEHITGPDGSSLAGTTHCTAEARCTLTLDQLQLTLVNVRLRVEPDPALDVVTTAGP
jgi:mannuronan synthase